MLPIEYALDVLLGDIEPITIPDCTLEQNSDGDGQLGNSGIIEFVVIKVTISFLTYFEYGKILIVWVIRFLFHDVITNKYIRNIFCKD